MATHQRGIGNRIAPPRFILFCAVALVAVPAIAAASQWYVGVMAGFDLAALVFLLSLARLIHTADPDAMREASARNDANRALLLVISGFTTLAVMAAMAGALNTGERPTPAISALVLATVVLSYLFGNVIYALHYAHLYYQRREDGHDSGGIDFEGDEEPVYWDFLYFTFTIGMAFATSDTHICTTRLRRIAVLQALNAFVFNLGVIAFTVGVLGG